MESLLKDTVLTSSKVNNKQNINIEDPRKNNEKAINLNKNISLISSNTNNNKIQIEEKYFINLENKDIKVDKNFNIKEDKYLIKSNLLNNKAKKLSETNILGKTEKNSDKFLNLKI